MLPRLLGWCCTGFGQVSAGPGFNGQSRGRRRRRCSCGTGTRRFRAKRCLPRGSPLRRCFRHRLHRALRISCLCRRRRRVMPPTSGTGDVFPAVPAGGFCPVIEVVLLTVCPVTLRLCVVCVFACDMRVEDGAACVPAGPCLPSGVLTLSDRLRLAGEAGAGVWRVPCSAAPFRFAPSLNVCCRITELLCDMDAALCYCEAVCTPPV